MNILHTLRNIHLGIKRPGIIHLLAIEGFAEIIRDIAESPFGYAEDSEEVWWSYVYRQIPNKRQKKTILKHLKEWFEKLGLTVEECFHGDERRIGVGESFFVIVVRPK